MSEPATPQPAQPQEPELNRLRAELETTHMQLAAAQAGLADYAYSVSHDLRANLRHITAYVGLIREELGDSANSEVANFLNILTNSSVLMARQIDGLVRWSQLDRVLLDETSIDLHALIEEVRQSMQGDMVDRQIDWQIAADFPAMRGDSILLRELFRHLLSNALKFTRTRPQAAIQVGCQNCVVTQWRDFVQYN